MSKWKTGGIAIGCTIFLITGCSSEQSTHTDSLSPESTENKKEEKQVVKEDPVANATDLPSQGATEEAAKTKDEEPEGATAKKATNQEQENGIEYVNKSLGFSLIIPESWEGKYAVKEEESGVTFIFQYRGKTYDTIPPLFSIFYKPKKEDNGWEEGLRWIKKLGSKNDRAYYYSYDALYFYDEGLPPGEEKDTVLAMWNQMGEVFDSFKMLEAEGAVAKDVKPKEEEAEGTTAEEATKQEQANGIKYVNGELGFELTLPKFWKDHYIVEENDSGGVTFKFKFDGKVYDDIYLFDLFVENREYSKEEQETMGDIGILDVKNGKTYLIAENIAMYAPPQAFDKYFSSVPKEGRNVIKAMSKQKKILNFKVLEDN